MNVAIIGAGNMGTGLAGPLVKTGHTVTVAARDAERVARAAAATGATPAASPLAAAAAAEIVILAVPFTAGGDVAAEIAPVSAGKVVIDLTNPMKPDGSGPLFDGVDSGAERFAAWLPQAHVVKAFNTIFASNLGRGAVDGVSLDAYIAGDDAAANGRVAELATDLGLTPVDVGPLTAARSLESLAWLNISLNVRGGSWQSGWKLLGLAA